MNLTRQMLIFILLSLLPIVVLAAGDCFCLEDDAANIRYGCFTQKKGYRDETHCLNESGGEFVVTDLQGWTPLQAGTGRCDPCRQALKIGKQIRAGDNEDKGAGETSEADNERPE